MKDKIFCLDINTIEDWEMVEIMYKVLKENGK